MGRKLADATNAWRIRRTRGDILFFRLFAATERICAPVFLLVIFAAPDVFFLGADAVAEWDDFAFREGT
jgi:hypothetical protein